MPGRPTASSIDRLNRLQSEYFIANQQGDLIFVLAAQAAADAGLSSPT